ncbi:unnamed protein product [Cuscuta europaea]|uniref:Uncharacterized protein n=1 Tax=Cuscuta europaea TaxID=41803 RepID=A0A9P0ZHM5_CUSEU|nr:unnamed protein product [Cuscuta europaea]
MDVNSLFAMKKTKGKKKDPLGPKLVGAPTREEPSQAAIADSGAGSSKGEGALKKKSSGKGIEPSAKRLKAADYGKQPTADVVIVEEERHASGPIPQERPNQEFFGREKLEAIVPKDASILEGNFSPSELMSQMMPSADCLALAQMSDEGLNSRILQNNAFVYMGLCEHFRRVEQLRQETLWAATEGVETAKAEGRAEGQAEGEPRVRLRAEPRVRTRPKGLQGKLPRLPPRPLRGPRWRRRTRLRKLSLRPLLLRAGRQRSTRSDCPRWWRLLWMLGLEAPAKCGLLRGVTPIMKVESFLPSASSTVSLPGTSTFRRRSSSLKLMAFPLGNQMSGFPSPKVKKDMCSRTRRQ